MVEVIVEAGLNHNGKLDLAKKLADKAKLIEADAVKFQTYIPEMVLRRSDPDFALIESLALPSAHFIDLAKHCEDIGIEFMTTPGDLDSLRFVVEELGVKRLKIGSDDLTNYKLLFSARKTGLPLILSTGMATFADIWDALCATSKKDITVLHCVSCYPCKVEDANISAIAMLRDDLRRHLVPEVNVGYSDHTRNELALFGAAALGASLIEAHMKLAGEACVDEAVSFLPLQLWNAIRGIKQIEQMLGSGKKEPCAEELVNMARYRKGEDGLRGIEAVA